MGKKSAEMAYASKQIKSSKWLLLLCAASAAAVDVAIMVLLIIGGMGAAYLVCPIILFAFDLIYFVVSLCFTNFRFKYSLAVWISYVVFYAVGMAIELSILLGGNGTVISNFALIIWSAVHAFNIVCAIVAALYSSRVLKHIWLGIVFAVIFIIGCGGYIAYICTSGFFGQGLSSRPLVFKYDSASGEYTATDVLAGRSKKVIVPATFNGKPVTALSFNVLANGGVKEYSFAADIKFTDDEVLDNELDLSGKSFFVDKEAVNDVRATLYGYTGGGQRSANAVALANATLPTNLSEGEGYVAFVYDANSYALSKGKVLPVYVGDLSSFNISSYTAGYDYITYRNYGDAEHLDWAFKNGGYILNDISSGENSLFNGAVTDNTIAELKFDKIYRVTVESGNDSKYDEREKQPDFCFDTVGGNTLSFRYVTSATAESFTAGLEGRKGFNLKWLYYDGGVKKNLSSLPSVLAALGGSDVTVSPLWELKAPTVNITTTAQGNRLTYGEDVTLNSNASIEADGIQLEYRWAYNAEPVGNPQSRDENWTLVTPKPDESGEYRLTVLAMGGETTSCTALVNTGVNIVIDRKPIEFKWDVPENFTYNGAEQSVRYSFDRSQLVGDDDISYTIPVRADDAFVSVGADTYTVKHAGTYNPEIRIDGGDAAYYDAGDTLSITFTVKPFEAEVVWSNADGLVYNASLQSPSASANGVGSEAGVSILSAVEGARVNAGENYTATATTENTDYTLKNATQVYSIKKAPLTVTAGSASAVYGSAPDASAIELAFSGFAGNEDKTVLGGAPVYTFTPSLSSGEDYRVGTYTEGVSVSGYSASNYEITYINGGLTITPRVVEISWALENPVYNAQAKTVTANVVNVLSMDSGNVSITVTGDGNVNAGAYTATAAGLEGSRAENYVLPEIKTWEYTIQKAQVTITADAKNSVYGEVEYGCDLSELLSATVSGTIYGVGDIEYTLSVDWTDEDLNGGGTLYNAGEYAIKIALQNNAANNYTADYAEGTYTITPKAITASDVEWKDYLRLAYTGTEKDVKAVIKSGVLFGDDEVSIVVADKLVTIWSDGTKHYTDGDKKSVGGHMALADSLTGAEADNYKLTGAIEQEYGIDPASLIVTWKCNGETIQDGAQLVYDGTEKLITAEFTNLAECDRELVTLRGTVNAIDVGNYTASVSFDNSISNNYTFYNPNAQFFVYAIIQAESELTVYFNEEEIENGTTVSVSVGDSISWLTNAECKLLVTAADGGAVAPQNDPFEGEPVSENAYTFETAGTYTVKLTAGDKNHSVKAITFTVIVEENDEIESRPDGE